VKKLNAQLPLWKNDLPASEALRPSRGPSKLASVLGPLLCMALPVECEANLRCARYDDGVIHRISTLDVVLYFKDKKKADEVFFKLKDRDETFDRALRL
jgi:hypothetical protein